jgi:Lon protease-like protein
MLPDGRSHILLEGVARVRTVEIPSDRPYRKVRCELVAEPEGDAARAS